MQTVTVLGAGLAGSECAWQLAKRGIHVRLVEMKPRIMIVATIAKRPFKNFQEILKPILWLI